MPANTLQHGYVLVRDGTYTVRMVPTQARTMYVCQGFRRGGWSVRARGPEVADRADEEVKAELEVSIVVSVQQLG